jgi:8-oxo-dGTP pyrophosphatase MutT (NUDIX family)
VSLAVPPFCPRPSSTVLVVRPADAGPEVLLLRRADKGDHNSNAWVFPGGLVDPRDRDAHAVCTGVDDAAASRRLGLAWGLDSYVAAIRETFEEAGLLLAVDASGRLVDAGDASFQRLCEQRAAIACGQADLAALCREHGLRLAADRLHYVAHWITPTGMPKRFDTRFFLALLPPRQEAGHDAVELLEHGWFRPAQLLLSTESRKLMYATRSMLELLARYESVEQLMDWAAGMPPVPTVLRRRATGAAGPQVLNPDHPAWPEVGLLDPEGTGTAWCELRPGLAVPLAPSVLRLTNADGNAYLLGDPHSGWVAIDAGALEQDRTALLAATGGQEPTFVTTSAATPVTQLRFGSTTLVPVPSPAGTAWLLTRERLMFTGHWIPAADELPQWVREGAAWAAPRRGFLVPLQPPAA